MKGEKYMSSIYGPIGIFFFGGIIFGFICIFANWLIRPSKPSKVKGETYECGLETQGPSWVQFKINYFLYALIFLVFDIEVVFLYPWAVKFQALGLFAFVEIVIFVGMLVLGLWYAWKKGALEWK